MISRTARCRVARERCDPPSVPLLCVHVAASRRPLHNGRYSRKFYAVSSAPAPLTLAYLNGPDVAALALTDDEILAAVEAGLKTQGEQHAVIEPRVHPVPGIAHDGTAI